MEDSAVVAAEMFQEFQDLIAQGLPEAQVESAREGVIKWLKARIDGDQDRSIEEQRRLVEAYLPQEIKDKFTGLNSEDRYDSAATAFDQWHLRTLDRRIYERAKAFLEKRGDVLDLRAAAEVDLRELRAIEDNFQKNFPKIYQTFRRIISESKVDSFYVLRDGELVSRRLGNDIRRMKREQS